MSSEVEGSRIEHPSAHTPSGPVPRHTVRLTLVGLGADKQRLRLVDDQGVEYTLDVDARLRTALRGDDAGTGKMERKMDSALRPRDIQARIRAGESAEDLAAGSGTPIEKILPYAAPVLAEREHMAVRAQASSVRRQHDTGARTLGEAVEQQMHAWEADHEAIVWDAWQREDRRWILVATFDTPHRAGIGQFVFDPRGNYVTCSDDDARWLVGDESAAPAAAEPSRDDLAQARERRLSAVVGDLAPTTELLDPAPRTVTEPEGPEASPEVGAPAPQAPEELVATENAAVQASEPTVDLSETAARIRGERPGTVAPDEQPAAPAPSEQLTLDDSPEPPPAPRKRKSRSRASVPSWDEIMFGGPPSKD